jgi:GAF domain-containing protein
VTNEEPSEPATLDEARRTIASQAEELDRLRRGVDDGRFARDLRETLMLAAAAGTIGSPVKHERLLEMVLQTAADVIQARAGALFLVDARTQELTFEAAIGPKAQQVKGHRVPLGQGVAGLVAVSGQPMAVSDAQADPRLLDDIGEKIGYEPQSLLCVPLVDEERVVGVLELLDKVGSPSFGAGDMALLGEFAELAAVALEMSLTYRHLAPLVGEVLATLDDADVDAPVRASLRDRSLAFAARVEEEPSYQETLELAELVQEIAWEGDRELEACLAILRAFARFLKSRPDPFAVPGPGPEQGEP